MAGPIIRAGPVTVVLRPFMPFRRRGGSPSAATSLGRLLASLLLAVGATQPAAAPYTPTDDRQVLATVPARDRDLRARELAVLRKAWQAAPQQLDIALALARGCIGELLARGDPRHAGCAQAALAPWWAEAAPPAAVRVERAVLLQFEHRFDEALADLDAALAAEPDNAAAWAWRTAILLVLARPDEARPGCRRVGELSGPLLGSACLAQIDALTGSAAAAALRLRAALAAAPAADAPARLWSLTRLAEIESRRGQVAAAEAAFREALALDWPDVYLRAAYADLLLDLNRAPEVLTLLERDAGSDLLLLRLAQAGLATRDPRAARWSDELAARFAAARQRGDTTHRKEEARFLLSVRQQPALALPLARLNWQQQREPADARLLLEAALAAGEPAAAQPVLQWMDTTRIESAALQPLAQRLRAAGATGAPR
jgi:predicted Zn-dependent protease